MMENTSSEKDEDTASLLPPLLERIGSTFHESSISNEEGTKTIDHALDPLDGSHKNEEVIGVSGYWETGSRSNIDRRMSYGSVIYGDGVSEVTTFEPDDSWRDDAIISGTESIICSSGISAANKRVSASSASKQLEMLKSCSRFDTDTSSTSGERINMIQTLIDELFDTFSTDSVRKLDTDANSIPAAIKH